MNQIDQKKQQSPILEIPVAFADRTDVPTLLGMKLMLADFNFSYDSESGLFMIDFP